MKILFVINSLVGGGAERVFVDMLRNINRNRFDIDLLVVDEWGIHCEEIREIIPYQKIIRHVSSPKPVRWFFGGLSLIKSWFFKMASPTLLHKRYIKKEYDIEVAYLEGISTKIVAGADKSHTLTYAWIHTDMIHNPWATMQYRSEAEEKKCYQDIDKVVAVSQSVKEAADKKFQIHAEVQYNVVDNQRIERIARCGNRELKRQAATVLISVGTLWKIKGYLRLIQGVEKLLQLHYDVELHIIGEGEDRMVLESYISQNQLEGNIHLHGFQKDPYDLMSQGDIYVCASYAEGFSTSLVEALILELPVVTTRCAGMEEILGDSKYGLITDNDNDALFDGMKKMVTDVELRLYYQKMARVRKKEFETQRRLAELERMFIKDLKARE